MLKSRGVSDMTPFEAEGYTKDTVFRVTTDAPRPLAGALVALWEDDGTDMPCFTDGSVYGFVELHRLKYVSGPRNLNMTREELTTLINEILDAREGLPTIPPEFTRWRGGERPVPFDTEVEVILRDGARFSKKAGTFDWNDDANPRDIIAYRIITDARAVEARELRAWFNEHAPTKFKQGDMVLYCGQLCIVVGVDLDNALSKYAVMRNGQCDVAREEELTRYEEGE